MLTKQKLAIRLAAILIGFFCLSALPALSEPKIKFLRSAVRPDAGTGASLEYLGHLGLRLVRWLRK